MSIATLFVGWRIINCVFVGAAPTPPILVGGARIVAGGLTVAFWTV